MTWGTKEAKIAEYSLMIEQLKGLCALEKDKIASLANSSALLAAALPHTVFAGYYLYDGKDLVSGPFQGNVSCTRIQLGKGVCGESAQQRKTVIIDNVKTYQNYISCDAAAQSEIVIPLEKAGQFIGVLDLDSSEVGSYDEIDKKFLEEFVTILLNETDI